MTDVRAAMKRLVRANARVAELDADREAAMRERDEALRAAKAAGATYEVIKAETGLSNATVVKALRRLA